MVKGTIVSLVVLVVKNLPAMQETWDLGSIPGLGRSQEKEMVTHTGVLVWEIPWTEEPGRLQSKGHKRVRHNWNNLACKGNLTVLSNPIIGWKGLPGSSDGKESACNAGDPGSYPGSERSPGEGSCNPLQYSCLENSMDREAWWATAHGITKSQTWL